MHRVDWSAFVLSEDDPLFNCAALICCPPEEAARRLAAFIVRHCGPAPTPEDVATLMIKVFVLLPPEARPLVDKIAQLARMSS